MAIFYVSDLLADLIGAEMVRDIVRNHCAAILVDVPEKTAERLRAPLHYIAGKCMGYPAVWIASTALDLTPEAIVDRLRCQPGPLYISLTTSIADDFIDKDENITAAHMMLLYLFMFSALRHPHWFSGELLATYQRLIYPLIGAFVGDPPLAETGTRVEMELRAERSSWRIGNFFETIVRALTIDDREETRSAVAEVGRVFGNWCSHLDDVVDVERDVLSGDTFTYPLFLLTEHSPALARAVRNRDLDSCLGAIGADWFIDMLIERHERHLAELRGMADAAGFHRLGCEFERLRARIPPLIAAIRQENSQSAPWAPSRSVSAGSRCT